MQMIIYLVFQHCQPHSYGTNNGYICQPHPIYLAPGLDGSLGTLTFSNVCGNVWSLKVWHLEHSFMIALPWTLGKFLWEFVRVQHLGEKQPVFFFARSKSTKPSRFYCDKVVLTPGWCAWPHGQNLEKAPISLKTEAQTLHREIGNEGAVFQAADLVGWRV